jgi:hypothetical protein
MDRKTSNPIIHALPASEKSTAGKPFKTASADSPMNMPKQMAETTNASE